MLELLQSFSRAILSLLSGAMIIYGVAFLADRLTGSGNTFDLIIEMYKNSSQRPMLLAGVGLTAYVLGIINVAGSSLIFNSRLKDVDDDLDVVARIESLGKPFLLKETLDLLHIKRTLVAFIFPLFIFGLGVASDPRQWTPAQTSLVARLLPIGAGLLLAATGPLAYFWAKRMATALAATTEKLSQSQPEPSKSEVGVSKS